jgi:hypothetical protein
MVCMWGGGVGGGGGRVRWNLTSYIQGSAEAAGMILFDTTVIANLTTTATCNAKCNIQDTQTYLFSELWRQGGTECEVCSLEGRPGVRAVACP